MSEREIKNNLCYYDPENQNNNLDAYENEDRPQPRNECSCDNCFYGRDKLAMQILEAKSERDEAREQRDALKDIFPRILIALQSGNCTADCSVDFLQMIPQEVRLVRKRLQRERDEARAERDRLKEVMTRILNTTMNQTQRELLLEQALQSLTPNEP